MGDLVNFQECIDFLDKTSVYYGYWEANTNSWEKVRLTYESATSSWKGEAMFWVSSSGLPVSYVYTLEDAQKVEWRRGETWRVYTRILQQDDLLYWSDTLIEDILPSLPITEEMYF